MFFTGDSSVRRRVDLGGRSSKERDRQNLLEQARVERKKRLGLRQSNSAALKIQKFFRGRKVVELARSKLRENFFYTFGERCQNVDRYCFHPDSDFLRQLLFVFDSHNIGDFYVLLKTCQLFHHFVQESGNIVSFLGGGDYSSTHTIVDIRVKRLAYACLQAVHGNRDHLKDQFYLSSGYEISPINTLLQTVATIIDPNLPWSCKVVGYLTQKHIFAMLRNIVLKGMKDANAHKHHQEISPVESVLILIASHIGGKTCGCPEVDPQWSFFSQILSIPFLWQHFPYLQEAFAQRQGGHYIHQMALHLHSDADFLPQDISPEFPGYACLLGNILEIAVNLFCQSICTFDLAKEFGAVSTFLLEALPHKSLSRGGEEIGDDEIDIEDNPTKEGLNKDLESQISNAISPRLLHDMVNVLFRETSLLNPSPGHVPSQGDVAAVGVICSLLNVIFNLLPLERFMTGLAYRTDLIPMLWNFMKRCHENKKWPSLNEFSPFISGDAPGWLVPLAVFCPVYKHMLTIVDEEEFYDQKKPLSLTDIRKLIIILRETLWQLLWVIPAKFPATQKPFSYLSGCKRNSVESMQNTVAVLTSELLSQLQDWNNRKEFTSASDFHAHEAVDEIFISQSTIENSRAYEILKHAPFLVPFTSRVRIVTSQLASARQRSNAHAFTRNRFRIRRDRIFEDAFNQMRVLSDDDLRGLIRITFVNEFGVEEAGIDGGGIFKDFMENITRAGFDVQYGLFKETTDHLLYPNPGSGLVHEQHLHFFHFLGIILGKAMFEGILVDIPFATFFLSKLKQKHNYLNDLPSLDPELYRHLLFLKHYEGDISELELYFVIINNEYGEQIEEELLPGGTNLRVTNENVITYIHLIANHRLNFQIRQQSTHFLRGFQLLIQKEWIAMFNEHELQILISGSLEGMDVNDLRSNAHYSGGYHDEHFVIVMFWDVIKNFSLDKQKKFLKFVTGCSRGPLLGFKYLEPQFCIQLAGAADPEVLDRLPTSATCMNLLKLPPYRSKEQLEMKLIYAINADAGFDLS